MKDPMRILIVSDFYPPFIGGAERQMSLIATYLTQRDHAVCVATVWHRGLAECEVDAGVEVRRIRGWATQVPYFYGDPDRRRYHPPFPDPGFVWKLRGIIKDFKPDVLHAWGWSAYSCGLAVLQDHLPLIISVRDYGYNCATRLLLYDGKICSGPAIGKCLTCAARHYGPSKGFFAVMGIYCGRPLLTRTVDQIHCVSTFVQHVTRRDLYKDRQVSGSSDEGLTGLTVIPNSISENETQHFHSKTLERDGSIQSTIIPDIMNGNGENNNGLSQIDQLPQEPFILFVGALQKHKGIYQLLEAYQRLSSPPPLVLIGMDYPDSPKSFPSGVVVFYNLPHSYVMTAWAKCIFGVLPSICAETFGNVIIEAMSQGKAVISSDIGGPSDIIKHGVSGLLIPPGDVQALAGAMQKMIDDLDLRQRLGRAAKEQVESYSPAVVIPQFEALYQKMVAKTLQP